MTFRNNIERFISFAAMVFVLTTAVLGTCGTAPVMAAPAVPCSATAGQSGGVDNGGATTLGLSPLRSTAALTVTGPSLAALIIEKRPLERSTPESPGAGPLFHPLRA